MNRYIFFTGVFILLLSCTLLDTPLFEYEAQLNTGEYYIDSLIIDTTGLFQFEFYSQYPMDIVFFDNYSGIQLFKDSGIVYSEMVYYPLMFLENDYFLQNVFFYETRKLYFIVDNSDNMTISNNDSDFKLRIFYKEE